MRLYVRKDELIGANYISNYDCPIARMLRRVLDKRFVAKVFSKKVMIIDKSDICCTASSQSIPVACFKLLNGSCEKIEHAQKNPQNGHKVTIVGLPKYMLAV